MRPLCCQTHRVLGVGKAEDGNRVPIGCCAPATVLLLSYYLGTLKLGTATPAQGAGETGTNADRTFA